MSPGKRLALASALVAGLLATFAVWFALDSYDGQRSQAQADLRSVVAQLSVDTRSFTTSRFDALRTLANRMAHRDGLELPRVALEPRETPLGFSGGLGVTDATGALVDSTAGIRSLGPDLRRVARRVSRTGRPAQTGMVSTPALGGRAVVFAVPVRTADGRSGVLMGGVTFRWLVTAVAAYRLPEQATLWIVSHDELIAGPALRAPRDVRSAPLTRLAAASPLGVERGRTGFSGRPDHLVAWSTDPRSGWRLFVEQPEAVAFAPFADDLERQLAGIAAVLLLGAVGIVVLARQIDRLADEQRLARASAERRLHFARSLGVLAGRLAKALTLEEVHQTLSDWCLATSTADEVAIGVTEGDYVVVHRNGRSVGVPTSVTRVPPVDAVDPLWPEDTERVRREAPWLAAAATSAILLPLVLHADALGVVVVAFREPQELDEEARDHWLAFAAQAAGALERSRLTALEREVAVEFQRRLLPGSTSPSLGSAVSAVYRPAETEIAIGGDWYDAVDLPDGRVVLVVGDVIGHGVAAAVVMGQIRTAIVTLAPSCDGPAELLERLDVCTEQIAGGEFSTVQCAYVDVGTGIVRCASAGHPPMAVVERGGEARFVWEGRSEPLCVGTGEARAEAICQLQRGAALVLFTDGLYERPGTNVSDGLEAVLKAAEAAARSPSRLAERIAELMLADAPPRDDVAVLTLELQTVPNPTLVLPLRGSLRALRDELQLWLTRHVDDDELIRKVVLAVHEAAANALEHGARGEELSALSAYVEVTLRDHDLDVCVRDNGRWHERLPLLDPERDTERGRGLTFIRHLPDSATIDRSHGTTVRMRFRVPPTAVRGAQPAVVDAGAAP